MKQRQLNSPPPTPVRTPFVNGSKGIFSHPVHWDAVVVAGKSHGQGSNIRRTEIQESQRLRYTRCTTLWGTLPRRKILAFSLCNVRYLKNYLDATYKRLNVKSDGIFPIPTPLGAVFLRTGTAPHLNYLCHEGGRLHTYQK